jgi:hypothetical protein
MTPRKELIIALLDRWIRQRPGLEFGNYCSGWNDSAGRAAYQSEVRSIGKDLAHARTLLRAVELSGITGEELAAAFPRAYSGRLSLVERYRVNGKGRTFATIKEAQKRAAEYLPAVVAIEPVWSLDYCTGQYWPTEYRRAACAVLASALWAYKRDRCMPDPITRGDTPTYLLRGNGKSPDAVNAGTWLRSSFRRDFGRGIANRWFD